MTLNLPYPLYLVLIIPSVFSTFENSDIKPASNLNHSCYLKMSFSFLNIFSRWTINCTEYFENNLQKRKCIISFKSLMNTDFR